MTLSWNPVTCGLVALLALALGGCASVGSWFENVEATAADVFLPVPEEVALGKELAAEVERQSTLHPDSAVQQYIAELGRDVAARADAPDEIEFTFTVIQDDEQVNAFALPGGHIYVYSGLLLAADDEAEVASVLAHEAGHVTQRHVAQRIVASYGLERVMAVITGEESTMAGEIVGGILSQGMLLRYGRDQESEADRVGIDYLIEAGYDPHAFVTFFEKLTGGAGTPTILSSHPHPEDRIAAVERLLEERSDLPDFTGRERYQEFRRRV